MIESDAVLFSRLKESVHRQAQNRLNITKPFAEWSLNDIADFQADLEAQCKSSISEKWFYNHFKNEGQRLPRIDVLNLLSEYAGFKNWDDFIREKRSEKSEDRSGQARWMVLTGLLIMAGAVWWLWPSTKGKIIMLQDAYTREEIPAERVKMWFTHGQYIQLSAGRIKNCCGDTLYIDGPYYKRQKRKVGTEDTLWISLYPDDYALMLNYFSRSSTENWQKRRMRLMEAFHPEAKIFQSHPRYEGIELLNRDEFIERLTLPINSLRNLEIQDIIYRGDKIFRLRFTQIPEDDENKP